MDNQNTFNFSTVNIIRFLWRNKWPIVIVSVLAFVISVIVSLVITPKYKAYSVFYPTVNQSVSKALLGKNNMRSEDVLKLGEEEDVEQIMQILSSDYIKGKIVTKYDLYKHYQIDTESREKNLKLGQMYSENISFKKTQFMAIQVTVLDVNPDTAAFIANDIVAYLDTAIADIQKEVALKSYKIVEQEYFQVKKDIRGIVDSLEFIRSKGVYDIENQIGPMNEAYWSAVVAGKNKEARKIKEALDKVAKYGGAYQSLLEQLDNETERMDELKQKFAEVKVNMQEIIPHKFVVNKAYAPDKKSTPRRTILVIVSTLSAFLFSIFLVIVIDAIKEAFKTEE